MKFVLMNLALFACSAQAQGLREIKCLPNWTQATCSSFSSGIVGSVWCGCNATCGSNGHSIQAFAQAAWNCTSTNPQYGSAYSYGQPYGVKAEATVGGVSYWEQQACDNVYETSGPFYDAC